MTTKEVCLALGLSRSSLHRLTYSGLRYPFTLLRPTDRKILYLREDVAAFEKSRTVTNSRQHSRLLDGRRRA